MCLSNHFNLREKRKSKIKSSLALSIPYHIPYIHFANFLKFLDPVLTLHQRKDELAGVVFEVHYQVHPPLAQWSDVVSHKSGDNINGVGFMEDQRVLVLETRALTKLCQGSQRLIY